MTRPLRSRWEEQVWTTPDVSDGCRVLLLALVRYMDSKGYVCVPRPQLAQDINRVERRVSERLEQAVTANFLTRVRRGQKGVIPVYRAMLPAVLSETDSRPLNSTQRDGKPPAEIGGGFPPAERRFSGTPVGPTFSSPSGTHASIHAQEREDFTSELLSEEEEEQRVNDVIRRACESWGMPVPAELAS